jgi:hypothetical protein
MYFMANPVSFCFICDISLKGKTKKVGITSIIILFLLLFSTPEPYVIRTVYFPPLRLIHTQRKRMERDRSDLGTPQPVRGMG